MNNATKFSAEVRERAVRMVQEGRGEYPSLWKAVAAIASQDRLHAHNLAELGQARPG